jgi:hypothetical protein
MPHHYSTDTLTRGSGLESQEYGRGDPLLWPRDLYPQKLALTPLTSGSRSRTKAMEL